MPVLYCRNDARLPQLLASRRDRRIAFIQRKKILRGSRGAGEGLDRGKGTDPRPVQGDITGRRHLFTHHARELRRRDQGALQKPEMDQGLARPVQRGLRKAITRRPGGCDEGSGTIGQGTYRGI